MRNRTNLLFLLAVGLICFVLIISLNLILGAKHNYATDSVMVKTVRSQILADGKIASQNEANLHFQTGGKITRIGAKEGDSVYQGEAIANLDTYALQRQLTTALNSYRSTRDNFDQTNQNTTNGVATGQQRYGLEVANKANLTGQNETDIINDMVKRLVDQSQASLDNSVINVELANYAIQLSSLTAPFNGIVVHEDVNQAGVNITPLTSFMVIDPDSLVFRAQVNEQDIDYVAVGAPATFEVNGNSKKYTGTVSKIYPEKVTLPTGGSVYNVEISSPDLKGVIYAQAGSVQIQSNVKDDTKLVPRWTVLSGQEVWVEENDKPILKTITTGKIHGDNIEVLGGLGENDRVIVNPQAIVQSKYGIL